MARTAKRYLLEKNSYTAKIIVFKAGNYLRLSVDSDYTGSDSLENQRRLAKEYADRHSDIKIVSEYVDDGISGTTFQRPSFDRMMHDLKTSVINCVIVKDLSRFGREYIDAGNFIEKVFPFLGVRFISIVDRYDSEDPGCDKELLLISLKNLMNEMYARDISRKVGTTYQIKHQEHIFYRSSTIPYGYKMDENNENYCIDEASAEIVKIIFRKYHEGYSKYAISIWLYEHNILTPRQYSQTGHVYCGEEDVLRQWHISTISRILSNPVYIGNIVRHKTEQSFYAGKKSSPVPETEQVRIDANHTQLISETVFAKVQEMMKQTGEIYKEYRKDADQMEKDIAFEKNAFQRRIFCGDCKAPMLRNVGYKMCHREPKRIKIFKCSLHAKNKNLCDTRGIEELELCKILYTTIRRHISFIKGMRKLVDQEINFSFEEKIKRIEKEKAQLQTRKVMAEQEYIHVYSRYKTEEIQGKDFQTFRKDYLGRTKMLEEQTARLEQSEKALNKSRLEMKKMFADWLQFENVNELTEKMIETCVERIDVYAGGRIEVRLTYQDIFCQMGVWKKKGGISVCL